MILPVISSQKIARAGNPSNRSCLADCTSDLHTFFHKASDSYTKAQSTWSARLDRFYISHSEADLAVVKPVVSSDVQKLFGGMGRGFNSHVPACLHFFPLKEKGPERRRISDDTVENPNFLSYTSEAFEKTLASPSFSDADPIKRLHALSEAMRSASKRIFRENKHEVNKVVIFQKAVSLYRYLSSKDPDDRVVIRLIGKTPLRLLLSRSDDEHIWNTTKLKNYIDLAFKVAGVPDCNEEFVFDETVTSSVAAPAPKKINALKELKLRLPSTRSKIQVLRAGPDHSPSNDPKIIGPVIQEYYSRIWKASSVGSDRSGSLHKYLEDYDRRINLDEIKPITIELVQKAIHMAPDTSPGPDGVPFSAYKAIVELAGPIILDVCLFLGTKRSASTINSFNEAILFLLPKKETLEVSDTRPISVNNTGNRIVARVLFLAVVDASQNLIGDYQKMFLPGRKMTDHLHSLNQSYYQKVQDDLDHFVLFADTAKAFDSIHHDFIIEALIKQGFPEWFTNSVTNLLTAVRVSPSLAPEFSIDIERGVKQGCPLSPLLFILCYDVLHFKLTPLENIKVKAAADDLSIEAGTIEDTVRAFPIIDAYTVASGLGINRDKTVILSARNHNGRGFGPAMDCVHTSEWPLVKFADSHKYLGILFGRMVQVEDVFAAPAKKAADRARSFGTAIGKLNTQRRIIVFNVFITPIFSFVQQFYIMPSSVLREYRSIMRRAISPFGGKAWPYSQLCAPTSSVGFKQPLRDPWAFNILLILRGFDFSSLRSEEDLPWKLDGSFRVGPLHGGSKRSCIWDSPLFSDHLDLQLMEFMGPDFLDWDGHSPLPKMDDKTLKNSIIHSLTVSYNSGSSRSYTRNFGKDHLSHLRHRHGKYGVTNIDHVLTHFAKLP